MAGEKSTIVPDGSVSPLPKMRKKREFSKCILYVAGFLNVSVIVFTFIMVWRTNDLTPLYYLISATAAEVATGTGFYYNKAKIENKIKLMAIYGVKMDQNSFEAEDLPVSGVSPVVSGAIFPVQG